MSTGIYIDAVQGDTLGPVTFAFKDSEGAAFDLTGSTLSITIKGSDGDMVFTTGTDDEFAITSVVGGTATLKLGPEYTEKFFLSNGSSFRVRRLIGSDVFTIVQGYISAVRGL